VQYRLKHISTVCILKFPPWPTKDYFLECKPVEFGTRVPIHSDYTVN